jgi:hypothetical protein
MLHAIRKLLKDLLYTGGNEALDIARLSSLIAVISYWTGVFVHLALSRAFDPVAVGAGWAAVAGGGGAWIWARQSKESTKVAPPQPDAEMA